MVINMFKVGDEVTVIHCTDGCLYSFGWVLKMDQLEGIVGRIADERPDGYVVDYGKDRWLIAKDNLQLAYEHF